MNKEKIIQKIKGIFTLRLLIGLAIGGVGGYMYYYYIGCNSGSCAITSSPVNSTLYGVLLGGLLFYKEPKKELQKEENLEGTN